VNAFHLAILATGSFTGGAGWEAMDSERFADALRFCEIVSPRGNNGALRQRMLQAIEPFVRRTVMDSGLGSTYSIPDGEVLVNRVACFVDDGVDRTSGYVEIRVNIPNGSSPWYVLAVPIRKNAMWFNEAQVAKAILDPY
jgi:hypothetical protein